MEPKWLRIFAVVVAVMTVASAYAAFTYYSAVASTGCGLQSTNPLIFDQAEQVHTLDPQWAYSTPDWGAAQQVYQALILYNQSDTTNFSGQLAKNWTESPNGLHWNFTLWPVVHFSNGDPFNAYVMWYSLYRVLAMYGADQYLLDENFWLPNDWYNNPNTTYTAAVEQNLLWELNNWNFTDPAAGPANETSGNNSLYQANQSFRVLNEYEIELNLGDGYIDTNYTQPIAYTYLLAEMASVGADAVDPIVIDAHGGVTEAVNSWMEDNMMGTGPYVLDLWSPGNSISFKPSPNYWAAEGTPSPASTQPWNNNLQPAKSSFIISFQEDPSINIQNLRSGASAGASFAFLGPGTVDALKGDSCLTVEPLSLSYSVANGGWWIYMNQSYAPFNNLTVRDAIAHAINITYIDDVAFGGWASQWVGPVPPGYPGYNPNNLTPYSYDPALAKQLMKESPWPNGYPQDFPFVYVGPSPDWDTAMTFVEQNLSEIGIDITPIALNLPTYYTEQGFDLTTGLCIAQEHLNGGPFEIGMEFYSSDWIAPDDWTLNNVWNYGSANQCMGGYNNSAMNALAIQAAGEHNETKFLQDYATMTQTMYYNYTDVWFNVPTLFAVYNNNVKGLYPNPIGSCLPAWNLECNTEYAT